MVVCALRVGGWLPPGGQRLPESPALSPRTQKMPCSPPCPRGLGEAQRCTRHAEQGGPDPTAPHSLQRPTSRPRPGPRVRTVGVPGPRSAPQTWCLPPLPGPGQHTPAARGPHPGLRPGPSCGHALCQPAATREMSCPKAYGLGTRRFQAIGVLVTPAHQFGTWLEDIVGGLPGSRGMPLQPQARLSTMGSLWGLPWAVVRGTCHLQSTFRLLLTVV